MTETNERIPALEVSEGTLYQLPVQRQEGEVVSELEFHQDMARRRADDADSYLVRSVESYMDAGDHLIETRELMGNDDAFWAWVESRDGYNRTRRTAEKHMQVAGERNTILGAADGVKPRTLSEALAFLTELHGTGRKKELPSREQQQEPPTGGQDDEKGYDVDLEVKLQELEHQQEQIRLREEKLAERERKAKALDDRERRVKEENKDLKRAQKELQEKSSRLEQQHIGARAKLHAEYGDPTKPLDFGGISDEAWAAAYDKATDTRVESVIAQLNALYGWPQWMSKYSPEEAAKGISLMEKGGALVEAIGYISNWLDRTVEEVEAQQAITPKGGETI